MTPDVIVNNLNLGQGPVDAIENYFLFSGGADNATNDSKILLLDLDSDLDVLLGSADSELKTQLAAARINGGQNWRAAAYVQATGDSWTDAITAAMAADVSIEGVIACTPVTAAQELTDMQAQAALVLATHLRWIWILAAFRGINPSSEGWSDYLTAAQPITADVAAMRVGIVPLLHGNDLGVLAGRLASESTSIADSPMRVASGPLLGLGPAPVDVNGLLLDRATLSALDSHRYSVPWWYPDYQGMFWADGNLLDSVGGDYQVIENLRVVDKAARRVYPRCVSRIANRELNSTPASMAYHENYFSQPLRAMAKATKFKGMTFPGDIKPPQQGDIVITWPSRTEVLIYLSARPYNSPKKITTNIALDLS